MANPKIKYEIEAAVSGSDGVAKLERELERLSNTLEGDLAESAQQARQELARALESAAALQGVNRLEEGVRDASKEFARARAEMVEYGDAMRAIGAPTAAAIAREQQLASAVSRADLVLKGKRATLAAAQSQLAQYGLTSDRASEGQRRISQAIEGVEARVRRLSPAYAAAAQAAEQSGQRQGAALDTTSGRMAGLSSQLAALRNVAGAALGGSLVGAIAKDLSDVADGYSNLEARIKLATGEGQAFEQAMEGVTRVALDTNTNIESTGNLFARLTDAGKSAGLSAEAAQADALALSEVINQSIQVSGASAQASDAAVTQLIQGLQSGVLRGENFNSVMEQAPRLAKAMTDGLGVTTGELRKMAEAGKLSAEVVRDALRGQSQAVRSEFEQLPPTVGRAIQNLNTAWSVYVGEVNKATGASRTAATAIKALADNLETVVGFLIDVGQAAAAFAALRLAQQFLGIGAAAKTSAAAIAANTAALVASNAASATSAAGIAGVGAAAVSAAPQVGRFAALLGGLKLFSLAGVLVNVQEIGTWIGEGIAKLQGYKDASEGAAAAERERAKAAAQAAEEGRRISDAQAAANKAATDSQFELSKAAQDTLGKFDEMRSKGGSAAEAVSSIGKDFDLASLPGISNAASVLDKLAADGKLSATQFRDAWAEALKGEDLQVFETKARAALAGTARESERLAAIMDASLREAIRRSGADFDVLAGGMTKATRSAINDTDTIIAGLGSLREQGVNVGQALEASIGKGIKTADSQAGVEALRTRIESLRNQLGQKVADSLLEQLRRQAEAAGLELDKLPKKAEDVAERTARAFKDMGVKTEAELKQAATQAAQNYELIKVSGQATADGLSEAWKKMAEATIAANGGVASETLRAEAAMQGLEIAADGTGKAIVRAMQQGSQSTQQFTSDVRDAILTAQELQRLQETEGLRGENYLRERNRRVGSPEAAAEERKRLNVDQDGFTLDKSGNRLAAGGDLTTLTGIANFLQGAGLDAEQAKRLALEFSDGRGNIPYFSNPGQMKYGGESSTISQALLKAAERTTFGGSNAGAAPVGRTVNLTLNVGGQKETVPTTEEGANALIDSLRRAGLSAGV